MLYRTLIGSDPISAKERMTNDRLMVPGKFAEALPAYVINGLINALQILPEDRTRTVEQLRAELSASPVATAVSGQYQRPAEPAIPKVKQTSQKNTVPAKKPNKSKKGNAQIIVTTAVISLAVGLILFIVLSLTVFRDRINFNFGSAGTTDSSVSQTDAQPVVVPDFTEKSYLSITSNPVFIQNFKFREEGVYNDEIAVGYVVTQSIAPESTVVPGTEIVLYVSKGEEKIVLPDVTGSDFEEAKARLEGLGFKVEKIETSDGVYRENEVVSVAPVTEKTYTRGTTIYLRVYVPETQPVTNEFGEIIEPEETSTAPADIIGQ